MCHTELVEVCHTELVEVCHTELVEVCYTERSRSVICFKIVSLRQAQIDKRTIFQKSLIMFFNDITSSSPIPNLLFPISNFQPPIPYFQSPTSNPLLPISNSPLISVYDFFCIISWVMIQRFI